MELLDHRRRRSGIGSVRGDDVAEGEASNQEEVQTALSQEGQPKGDPRGAQGRDLQMTPKSGMETAREAISPGALELGLVASPFHSELIRSEVALRRTRRLTLDQDARFLAQSNRSFEEPRSSLLQEGVRVARVDTSSGAGEATEPVGRPQSFGPSGHQVEGETQKPPLAKGVSATNPGGMGSCPSPEEVRGSSSLDGGSVGPMEGALGLSTENQVTDRPELALALLESRSEVRPEPADSRELVPAGMGISGALEQMLVQVVEENRLLRGTGRRRSNGVSTTPGIFLDRRTSGSSLFGSHCTDANVLCSGSRAGRSRRASNGQGRFTGSQKPRVLDQSFSKRWKARGRNPSTASSSSNSWMGVG